MFEFFSERFALNEDLIDVGVDLDSKLVHFFTVDGDLAFFDQAVGGSSAGDSAIGDQFIKSDFRSRLGESGGFCF